MADLVIIDAPGSGYSHIQGTDAAAKFYGIDQDLAAVYEMKHLPMPPVLQRNTEYQSFSTGHEPYVDGDARHQMHDRIIRFINASQE